MNKHMPPLGLFIIGTDTGVGKTYVAGLIANALVAAGHRAGVYKPVASGCRRDGGQLVSDDALDLWNAAGQPGDLAAVCPQRFEAPLAPHLAARAEGKEIDVELLRTGLEYWCDRSDIVLVEGVGGLMSPLSDQQYNADLAYELHYPLLVVAPNILGVINQTLQTLITASTFREGLDIAGVVLNDLRHEPDDVSVQTNRQELASRCVPPVLAHVAWRAEGFRAEVNWFELAQG